MNQLTVTYIKLDYELQDLLLFNSLLDSRDWVVHVVTLTNSAPNGKLPMSILKDSILNEEAKRTKHCLSVTSTQSKALVIDSQGRM